ncbi:hypothetical protein ASE41_30750 [Streptomyces sp. Root264]|nr:hypothetical protein ASE41_30750 [Streptomyces sp. Root264]
MPARIAGSRSLHGSSVPAVSVLAVEVSAAMRAKVLERFPAGAPRGSWPAEEYAARRRAEGEPATVVMDLKSDAFLVVVPGSDED